jgi:transcriptional regulator with XRE-family HTH domain
MRLAEKLILEELSSRGKGLQKSLKTLSVGELVSMIRKQLNMSQKDLAKRAKVPQPTVSNLERSKKQPNLTTLRKILDALFCDLVVVPVLREPVETLLLKRARQKAEKRVRYLQGSMNLEKQEPDPQWTQELIRKETEELLHSHKLWEDDEKI